MSALWPCDDLPLDWQRGELKELRSLGYSWNNPHEIRDLFEKEIAAFTGAPFCVATQSCTDAIVLCLDWVDGEVSPIEEAFLPRNTYISVPSALVHYLLPFNFEPLEWEGSYQIKPTPIWDCAPRFRRGMYLSGQLQCLSFQIKKRLPIGRGGAILTDDEKAYRWLKQAAYDGRDLSHPKGRWQDEFQMIGRHVYLTPEDCARGLILFKKLLALYPDGNIPDCQKWSDYPDLSQVKQFRATSLF